MRHHWRTGTNAQNMPTPVALLNQPVPVQPRNGVVYSTAPHVGSDASGNFRWYVKDRDVKIVFAELCAYALAEAVGVATPPCGIWIEPQTEVKWFACREVLGRSGVVEELLDGTAPTSPVLDCAVFDVWIANVDRNEGGFVARSPRPGQLEVLAIDFEKARTLDGTSRFELATLPASSFLPSGRIANLVKASAIPAGALMRIESMGSQRIANIVHSAVQAVGGTQVIGWTESTISVLETRAANIRSLSREVWSA